MYHYVRVVPMSNPACSADIEIHIVSYEKLIPHTAAIAVVTVSEWLNGRLSTMIMPIVFRILLTQHERPFVTLRF